MAEVKTAKRLNGSKKYVYAKKDINHIRHTAREVNRELDSMGVPKTDVNAGVLTSERLLGESSLARLLQDYSPKFCRQDDKNFYGWIRPDIGVTDDYLVLAQETRDERGRVMRVAIIGARSAVRKSILMSLGAGIGVKLVGGSVDSYLQKAEKYIQENAKLLEKADRNYLKNPGTV